MSESITETAKVEVLATYKDQAGSYRLLAKIHKADEAARKSLTRMAYRFKHWHDMEETDPEPDYDRPLYRAQAQLHGADTVESIETWLNGRYG